MTPARFGLRPETEGSAGMAKPAGDEFIEDMLRDPLVRLLMEADRVDPTAMKAILQRAADRLRFGARLAPASSPDFPADPAYRSGVGIMLLNAEGRVFLGRRIDLKAPAWQMPQGGIEPSEPPRQAALRELLEETGVTKVEVLAETRGWLRYDYPPDIAVRMGRKGQQQKWFAMLFVGDDSEIRVATPHPEFSAWRWAKLDEVIDLIVGFKRELYQDVARALAGALPLERPAE